MNVSKEFKVIEIIDGDTIKVKPFWVWHKATGDIVRICGYEKPKDGIEQEFSKNKLTNVLLNECVQLKNPECAIDEALACSVLLRGINVSKYFPEFQNKKEK